MPGLLSSVEVPEVIERLVGEGPISISAAAAFCGAYRQGKPIHPSTLTRWALKGFQMPKGRVVKLETFRVAGRLMTSKSAVLRFIAAQNEPCAEALPQISLVPPTQRRLAEARASKRADEIFGPVG